MNVSTLATLTNANRSPDLVDVQYLNELMKDRAALGILPKRFMHLERILDQEIISVRERLFNSDVCQKLELPSPLGELGIYRKKVYIPNGSPHINYVGRLLGPRGKTLKSIEQESGCRLMIRGIGSSRQGLPMGLNGFLQQFNGSPVNNGYSIPQCLRHFGLQGFCNNDDNDFMHVQVQCEDTPNRAEIRIGHAASLIDNLFAPVDQANDVLKQKQLLELAFLRGNYKPPAPDFSHRPNANLSDGGYSSGESSQAI